MPGESLTFLAGNTRFVEQDVESRKPAEDLGGKSVDGSRIGEVDGKTVHAGMSGRDFVELLLAATGDDDVVAESMKGLGEGRSRWPSCGI